MDQRTISAAPPVELILEHLGPLVREKVMVENRTFWICRPRDSDRLLDHPEVQKAFNTDEYMPYWADLWPAARMLAKAILRETWETGEKALEIGCGLGLAGLAALAMGLHVTFSDYDPCALRFAADNARLNGFVNFSTLLLDWRNLPPPAPARIVLGSDLIYEPRNVPTLVAFLQQVLPPGGLCLLADQDRVPAQAFQESLARAPDLAFSTQVLKAGEPGGRRLKGTIYRILKIS